MHHFSALAWLQRLCGPRHAEEPPSFDWQRYRQPAQPQERHTDGIARVIHQREQPVYEPPPERPMKQWKEQQEEIHLRYPEITKTGPRKLLVNGHIQEIIPHVVPYQHPGEAMRRATGPHTPIPATPADPLQRLNPAQLPPAWVRELHEAPLLATMRPGATRERYSLELPEIGELPTVPTHERAIMAALPPWEPLPAPTKIPTGWLSEDDGPQMEFWQSPEAPETETDAEIPTQKLVPELRYIAQNAPTAPDEFPALRQLLRIRHKKKESEA